VRTKSQLSWLNLLHLPAFTNITTTASDCLTTSGHNSMRSPWGRDRFVSVSTKGMQQR